jgi:hypothetical protein
MTKRFNGARRDGASLQAMFLGLLKCQRAHAAAVRRWRDEGPRLLKGTKAAALWDRTEGLGRKRRALEQRLRRKTKAYASHA